MLGTYNPFAMWQGFPLISAAHRPSPLTGMSSLLAHLMKQSVSGVYSKKNSRLRSISSTLPLLVQAFLAVEATAKRVEPT